MYSGVAPMGTRLSYTTSPTLLQGPMGSREAPRLISAAASSRRRACRQQPRQAEEGRQALRVWQQGTSGPPFLCSCWRNRPPRPQNRCNQQRLGAPRPPLPALPRPTPVTPPPPVPAHLERVGAQCDGARCLVGLHELHRLCGAEQLQDGVAQEGIVAVVGAQVLAQLRGARRGGGGGVGNQATAIWAI